MDHMDHTVNMPKISHHTLVREPGSQDTMTTARLTTVFHQDDDIPADIQAFMDRLNSSGHGQRVSAEHVQLLVGPGIECTHPDADMTLGTV